MSALLSIDAQALLWFLADDARLSRRAKEAIVAADAPLHISAIALAECFSVIDKGKLDVLPEALVRAVRNEPPLIVVDAVNAGTVLLGTTLAAVPELHDQLIVATVLELNLPRPRGSLITSDAVINASGLVDVIW